MRGIVVAAMLSLGMRAGAQQPLADVPFVLHQNAVIVQLVANDRDTLNLLLDTGWGPMALTDSAVVRLRRSGADLRRSSDVVTLASLGTQGLRKTDVRSEVFEAANLTSLIGPYDGVLATAYFHDLVLQIDYPRGRVRFFARTPAPVSGTGRSTLPLSFLPRIGWLPFSDSISFNGRQVRGLFDTGGSGAFMAMGKLVQAERLDLALDSTRARAGFFNGGHQEAAIRFARARSVRVGQFVVDTPRVVLAPAQLSGDDWGHDMIIGYGFMRHYVVTFDYPARTVTLERQQ